MEPLSGLDVAWDTSPRECESKVGRDQRRQRFMCAFVRMVHMQQSPKNFTGMFQMMRKSARQSLERSTNRRIHRVLCVRIERSTTSNQNKAKLSFTRKRQTS